MECMRIQPVTSHPGENALFIVLGLAQGDSVVENDARRDKFGFFLR